eukprot:2274683-Amphidinium_carterae.1
MSNEACIIAHVSTRTREMRRGTSAIMAYGFSCGVQLTAVCTQPPLAQKGRMGGNETRSLWNHSWHTTLVGRVRNSGRCGQGMLVVVATRPMGE